MREDKLRETYPDDENPMSIAEMFEADPEAREDFDEFARFADFEEYDPSDDPPDDYYSDGSYIYDEPADW